MLPAARQLQRTLGSIVWDVRRDARGEMLVGILKEIIQGGWIRTTARLQKSGVRVERRDGQIA